MTSSYGRQLQRGFINPFVDFLFGAFGSFLVLSVIMLALIAKTAKDPLTGFILIEFEDHNTCTTPGQVKFGAAIATSVETFWADHSNAGLHFIPGALSTDRQLIVFRGFSLTEEAELHIYLAELPMACQDSPYTLSIKKPGAPKQRIVLKRGGPGDVHKVCTLSEEMRLSCP